MKLKKSTKVIIGVCIIAVAIIGAASSDDKSSGTSKQATDPAISESKEIAQAEVPAGTPEASPAENAGVFLFKNADEFKNNFNGFTTQNDFKWEIGEIDVVKGDVNNTFQVMLNKNVGIIGTVNKTNNAVKEITMIATGDGTAQSGLDILTGIGCVIGATDPSLSATQRGQIMKDLGLMDDDVDLAKHSASKDKNGIHYWINASDVTGIMFGASKK